MRAAADTAPASDILGLAVLVALNIADEYFRARNDRLTAHGEMAERAIRLERIVDQVISQIAETKAG